MSTILSSGRCKDTCSKFSTPTSIRSATSCISVHKRNPSSSDRQSVTEFGPVFGIGNSKEIFLIGLLNSAASGCGPAHTNERYLGVFGMRILASTRENLTPQTDENIRDNWRKIPIALIDRGP